mmetsp:Transcript_23170/g.48238  ORF Transcript_23170/g.48238 Transcript_23170/m.48238 type:complete len:87 (-) Transcript_23170:84-344(-)
MRRIAFIDAAKQCFSDRGLCLEWQILALISGPQPRQKTRKTKVTPITTDSTLECFLVLSQPLFVGILVVLSRHQPPLRQGSSIMER